MAISQGSSARITGLPACRQAGLHITGTEAKPEFYLETLTRKKPLTTFLGQTVLNLTVTPQGSEAVTSDGDVYRHSSPNALVYQLTGLVLPISYMQDWIKGLPTAADQFALNDTNTLATLRKRAGSQSWDMHYLGYQTVNSAKFGALPLPYKMNLAQGESSLKIVISKWTLNG